MSGVIDHIAGDPSARTMRAYFGPYFFPAILTPCVIIECTAHSPIYRNEVVMGVSQVAIAMLAMAVIIHVVFTNEIPIWQGDVVIAFKYIRITVYTLAYAAGAVAVSPVEIMVTDAVYRLRAAH